MSLHLRSADETNGKLIPSWNKCSFPRIVSRFVSKKLSRTFAPADRLSTWITLPNHLWPPVLMNGTKLREGSIASTSFQDLRCCEMRLQPVSYQNRMNLKLSYVAVPWIAGAVSSKAGNLSKRSKHWGRI